MALCCCPLCSLQGTEQRPGVRATARDQLFTMLFEGRSLTGKPTPRWFVRSKFKWFVFGFFCLNLIVLSVTTSMVLRGASESHGAVRLLLLFRVPWSAPHSLTPAGLPGWAAHVGFGMYPIMLTKTLFDCFWHGSTSREPCVLSALLTRHLMPCWAKRKPYACRYGRRPTDAYVRWLSSAWRGFSVSHHRPRDGKDAPRRREDDRVA